MAIIHGLLRRRTCAITVAALFGASSFVFASDPRVVPLEERIQGTDVVVVATPSSVRANWQENAFGDRLIVSRYVLQVHETLKGMPSQAVSVDLEGGTLDGFTMRVSSLPSLAPGERAVFFLDGANNGGAYHAHLKGLGILKLDDQDVVRGSSLTLGEIRRSAAAVAAVAK